MLSQKAEPEARAICVTTQLGREVPVMRQEEGEWDPDSPREDSSSHWHRRAHPDPEPAPSGNAGTASRDPPAPISH